MKHNPWPKMTALAHQLPTARRFWSLCEPFDGERLWEMVNGPAGCPWSSGEKIAAQFLLFVFGGSAEDARFDFHRAVNVWDDAHLVVLSEWVRHPWFAGLPVPEPQLRPVNTSVA